MKEKQTNSTALVKSNTELLERAKAVFRSLDVLEATIKDYEARIPLFLEFMQQQKQRLTPDILVEYKRYLQKRGDLSVATKNKYFATAKIFLKELYKRGQLDIDITLNVKGFAQTRKHKRDGLNEEEAKRVLEYLNSQPKTKENIRLKAIVAMLLYQGLRQIELVRMNVDDVDLTNRTAWILGKGRDDKEQIHLHPVVVECLREYMKEYNLKSGALFVSISRRNAGQRLMTRSIQNLVKDVFEAVSIEAKTTHGFRHYFVTKLLKEYEGNITLVAKYTRHKTLEMLQVYNDAIIEKGDLPRFYACFNNLQLVV
jgi:integrase